MNVDSAAQTAIVGAVEVAIVVVVAAIVVGIIVVVAAAVIALLAAGIWQHEQQQAQLANSSPACADICLRHRISHCKITSDSTHTSHHSHSHISVLLFRVWGTLITNNNIITSQSIVVIYV